MGGNQRRHFNAERVDGTGLGGRRRCRHGLSFTGCGPAIVADAVSLPRVALRVL
ncbi:hypothetical protein ACFPRL_03580 [Pseudoclavibacter helvolus]